MGCTGEQKKKETCLKPVGFEVSPATACGNGMSKGSAQRNEVGGGDNRGVSVPKGGGGGNREKIWREKTPSTLFLAGAEKGGLVRGPRALGLKKLRMTKVIKHPNRNTGFPN